MKATFFSPSHLMMWILLMVFQLFPYSLEGQSLKIKAGCDSVVLDVFTAGATYSWSTGDTTATLTLLQTDTVWVDVTDAGNTSRDSFAVQVFSSPIDPMLADTTLCFGDQVTLNGGQGIGDLIWFDDSVGGNIIGSGDTLNFVANQSQSLYAARVNGFLPSQAGLDTLNAGGSAGGYISTSGRSLIFNAKEDFFLSRVTLHANNALTGTILLTDAAGTGLDSLTISLPGAGIHEVTLDFFVRQGTGYRLLCKDIVGGTLFLEFPVSFPLRYDALDITGGSPVGIVYTYFYDWRINATQHCASNRVPLHITVLPIPEVSLGPDTTICDSDSLMLDATFPGASYAWSTGDTLPTIQVANSDTIRVELALGQCRADDEIIVYQFQSPADPMVRDTTICGKGSITLKSQANGTLVWYDQAVDGNIITVADSLNLTVTDTSSVYIQAVNGLIPRFAGLKEPQPIGNSGYFPFGGRSIIFNAKKDFYLTAVTIYADDTVRGRVVLEDNMGNELQSRQVTLTQAGGNEARLNFFVPQGNAYRLTFRDLVGGRLYLQFPTPFPVESEFVRMTGGTPVGSQYSYFYNWKINHDLNCSSMRVKNTVSVAIPDYMEDSVFSCDPLSIGSGQPQLSHLWSTGDTTASITVSEGGEYVVALDDGANCLVYDTIRVEIPPAPQLPVDGVLCGNTLSTIFGPASRYQWSTGDTTPTISVSQPGKYWVDVIEDRGNCLRTDTINISAFANFPVVDLGSDLSACDSAVFDAGNPGQQYLWSTGDTTQMLSVYSTGSYWVDVTSAVGCTTRDTATATISRSPQANFFASATGFDVTVINLSTLTTTFMWNFGDGTQKTGPMPRHTYLDTGMFTITLIVVNSCGSDTFTQTVHIQDPNSSAVDPFEGRIQFYPNPASKLLSIRVQDMRIPLLDVQLIDLTAKEVKAWQLKPQSNLSVHPLALPDLPAGLYLLRIRADQKEAFYKLQIR